MIGAGSSGIASCQVLHARGIEFDCFEKGSGVGGNWRYENDNGMSSAYASLFINTSRRMMAYASYPMPESYPDYPHHTQIAAYFDDYVDHFGFRDRIRFNTSVERVEPDAGRWRVTLDDGTRTRPTTPCSWPTAITGTRGIPSRRSPGRRASPARPSTPTTTASPTSASATATCWCSASATRPPTSRWRPPGTRASPTWPCAAAPTCAEVHRRGAHGRAGVGPHRAACRWRSPHGCSRGG